MLKKFDGSKVYVVGHVEGIKDCWLLELISAGVSYSANYNISALGITRVGLLKPYTHRYKVFGGYFSFLPNLPNADITEENCVCVVPGAPTNLVANVAADNLFGTAATHKDDWHYIDFKWIGYPYWFLTGGSPPILTVDWPGDWVKSTLKHPGLMAITGARYYHLSHSQHTWGEQSRKHIMRYIDQEKRLYRPGQIDLKYDNNLDGTPILEDGTQKYLMTNPGKIVSLDEEGVEHTSYIMTPFGKKPFTRDNTTKRVISYDERMAVGGGASYTINGIPGWTYNMVFFFWPFIPYLWEIPYFNFFACANNETLYKRCITPESGSAFIRGWHFKSKNIAGEEQDVLIHADTATLTGRANVNVTTSAERPHYIFGPPPIYGVIGIEGSINGTWVDTYTNNWGYTASVEKTVPIGPVCNGQDLSVMNSIFIAGEYSDSMTETNTKATSLPSDAYLDYPSEPGWWANGGYSDASTIDRTITEAMAITAALQSELKFGSIVIESGAGSMAYQYNRSYTTNVDNVMSMDVHDSPDGPLPFYPHQTTYTGSGTRADNSQATGNMSRNIVSFAVLDYDSESNFSYDGSLVSAVAVVYKKITISHTLNRTRNVTSVFDTGGSPQNGIISNGDNFNGWPREPSEDIPGEIIVEDTMITSGTRTIEYKVYANVGGRVYTKTLKTLVITIGNDLSPTVTGQRIYGVVCKLQRGKLLVTYDLDDFVTTANANIQYDSPFNFEDWNSNNGIDIWATVKRVVGIVSLDADTGFGTDLYDEQDPIPAEVYSVSLKG